MKKLVNEAKGITFGDLSRFRGEIMGFAIIQIILLHFFQQYNSRHNDILSLLGKGFIGATASVGVEFFIIVSGVGLYYSLSANNAPGQFFKKRFVRVCVPYLIWGTLIFAIYSIMTSQGDTIKRFFYHFSFGSLLFDRVLTFWYIPFVMITYLLAPLVYKGVSGKRPGLTVVCWMLGAFAVTAILKFTVPTVYENTLIALHRFPIFFLGMYFGRLTKENKPITLPMFILMAIGVVLRLLRIMPFSREWISSYVSQYYIISFYSFFALYIFVLFLRVIKECFVHKALRSVGKYSFELYITHQGLRRICYPVKFPQWTIWGFGLIIVASVVMSLLLSHLVDRICGKGKKTKGDGGKR